jgi:hypothetical protein
MLNARQDTDTVTASSTATFAYSQPFLAQASREGAWDLIHVAGAALSSLVIEVCDDAGEHGVPMRLDAEFDTAGGVIAAAKGVTALGAAIASSFHQAADGADLAFRINYPGIYRWGFKSSGATVTIRHNAR